jgi:hypothetical protein
MSFYQHSPFQPSPFQVQQQIQERPPQFVEKLNVNCLQLLAGTNQCCAPIYRPAIWSPCINPCSMPTPIVKPSVVLTLCPPKNSCCPSSCGNRCCGGEPVETYQWKTIDPSTIVSPNGKIKMQVTDNGISVFNSEELSSGPIYTLPITPPTPGQTLIAGPGGVLGWSSP